MSERFCWCDVTGERLDVILLGRPRPFGIYLNCGRQSNFVIAEVTVIEIVGWSEFSDALRELSALVDNSDVVH